MKRALLWVVLFCSSCILLHAEDRGILYQEDFSRNRDYGPVPLPPDPQKPYYGPGYKLDFPDSDGNCGSCHIPIAAVGSPYGVNPDDMPEAAEEGVSCDFCHKIWDVRLQQDGLPAANRPGVLSIEFRRPETGHQLFMGPFDDVAPGEDTYLPLQRQSAFCASCHFGVFWDVPIYNSYGEWLASPYSDPVEGQTWSGLPYAQEGGGVLRTAG